MSQLCKHQSQIINIIKGREKQIKKKLQKKKNQYTLNFKFYNGNNEEMIKKIILIKSILPMELSLNNPFRLKSDLQLAQQRSNEQLGELFVDIFSANYRVFSVQKIRSMILLNLEPYHLEEVNFVEVEKYYQTVNQKYSQSLSKLQNIQEESLNQAFILKQVHTLSELKKLEAYTNNYPSSGYISKVKDGRRQTITKFMNMLMLAYMGITYEMLQDYVCETKNIPFEIYCGENYYDRIGEIYKIPSRQQDDPSYIEHQSYSGKRLYPKQIRFQKLILEEERIGSYLEYYFYWIEDFCEDINLEQIKINEIDYFNTKKQKDDNYQIFDDEIIQQIQRSKPKFQNSCGVRKINRNTKMILNQF